jgi:hypothetical protein
MKNNRVCMLQERAEIMAQAVARSRGQLRVYGTLPENAARKAGAAGAYSRHPQAAGGASAADAGAATLTIASKPD